GGLETMTDLATLVPDHAALGEDVRSVTHPFEGPRHHLLGVAQAVDRGRVNPVDACVQCRPDSSDRLPIVLDAPGEFPTRSTDRPRPKADRRNVKIRVS